MNVEVSMVRATEGAEGLEELLALLGEDDMDRHDGVVDVTLDDFAVAAEELGMEYHEALERLGGREWYKTVSF